MKMARPILFALAASLALGSCLGVDAQATISAGGSGSIDMEYSLSEELVAFGELESNKALLPIPVSRSDFERGIASYPGLSLDSWSERMSGSDKVVKARVSFKNLASLASMLDPRGNLASYSEAGARKSLKFVFGEPMPKLDNETESLAKEAFAPYSMRLTLQLPEPPVLSSVKGEGAKGWVDGKTARFESPMTVIALSPEPVSWTVTW